MLEPTTATVVDQVLRSMDAVAVVGLNDEVDAPAYRTADRLQEEGVTIWPIHPRVRASLGVPAARRVDLLAEPVEVIAIFLRPGLWAEVLADCERRALEGRVEGAGQEVIWIEPPPTDGVEGEEAGEVEPHEWEPVARLLQAGRLVVLGRSLLEEYDARL